MKKVKNEEIGSSPKEEIKESKKQEPSKSKAPLVFICNVNHNNKEYRTGSEWIGEVPKELEQFLK